MYSSPNIKATAELVQENSKLHGKVSGLQKLNALQQQQLAASTEGKGFASHLTGTATVWAFIR